MSMIDTDVLKKDILFFLSMEERGPNVWSQMMTKHGVHATTISHLLRVLQDEGKTRYDIQRGWLAC